MTNSVFETGSDILPRFSFGDSPELANNLLALVLNGFKTATCSALDEFEGSEIPRVGEQSVIEDGERRAACRIETISVETIPFDKVSASFAYLEGEGDRSLAHWRTVHEAYFRMQGKFAPEMPLVCEIFKILEIYRRY